MLPTDDLDGIVPSDVTSTGSMALDADQKAEIRVLVVDDDEPLCENCGELLRHEGYSVVTETRGDDALGILERRPFDIVLIDLFMRQVSGMDLLKAALETNPDTIVIVMTGKPSVDTSLNALREGAWDYVPKPFSATHLQILMGRAAHTVVVGRETAALKDDLEEQHGHSGEVTILGLSDSFQQAMEMARKVSSTDASVFLSGESGTGKELFAQFIHHHSRRSSRRIMAINCAALPEPLLESEMFGHVEGAFTGAVRDKPGLLEEATGGTLFLDELAEMPVSVQAKLLRVIQDGVVRRVGSTETDAVVNVRFIAATNQDPEKAVKEGKLREDLYYRLRVVPIRIPPLRERSEDVSLLARHFLVRSWRRHRKNGTPPPEFSEEALDELRERRWRGNVRELENVIEHAVVLLQPGQRIGRDDIPHFEDESAAGRSEAGQTALPLSIFKMEYHEARDRVLTEFQQRYLERIVQQAEGNMSEAARIASVDRTTLYRLMDKHDLNRAGLLDSVGPGAEDE